MGIDVTKLERSERKIGGIGGLIDAYFVELHGEKLRLFVGKHDLSKLDAEERQKVMAMPSLLGRDILYRCSYAIKTEMKSTRNPLIS